MNKREKKSKNKINYWVLILVITLALILVLSRARRASRRTIYKPPAVERTAEKYNTCEHPAKQIAMNDMQEIEKKYLLGKIDPSKSDNMVLIDNRYASREGMFMHKEAYRAFLQMHEAAANDGIDLVIISAIRTFDNQKRIWENKWNGIQKLHGDIYATNITNPVKRAKEILRFSAMPGTSRHHWGTDVDLNSLQNSYFKSGEGKKVYLWLKNNAGSYGFCQPYTPHGQKRGGGYEEEKWHWSYLPVAHNYLESFLNIIDYDHIKGFDGCETAKELDVINHYVKEIDPSCML